MYYFTYRILNNVNGKCYFGVHQTTNIDDGYLGSGRAIKNAIAKYGKENFTKEILQYFDDSVSMYAAEEVLVNEEVVNSPSTYNMRIGGNGGFDHINDGSTQHLERSHRGSLRGGATTRDKRVGIHADSYVSPYTKEHMRDLSSLAHTERAKIKRAQTFKALLIGTGTSNSQFGTKWMSHVIHGIKKVNKDNIQAHLSDGWIFGRKMGL